MKIAHIILLISFTAFFKVTAQKNYFQGTYINHYDKNFESPYGLIEIHYSDSATISFYLEIGIGAPSYNSGAIYGRLTNNIRNNHLEYLPTDTLNDCKLDLFKDGNKITIKTVAGDCPFGGGVIADGVYFIDKTTNPKYFTDRTGKKIYFNKTSPEKYLE